MVIFIERNETDPYFNIAAEEFVLKNFSEEVVMLWRSQPSVIIGKHQNPIKEVNFPYASANKIPLIRRISGGGTVFHDLGNINFSKITFSNDKNGMINFKKFLQPLIEYLQIFGVKADREEKNNLLVKGKKISGNSGHIFKNKVIHHGTVLFNSDIKVLEEVLSPEKFSVTDKAVASVGKPVVNLSEFMPNMSTEKFFSAFKNFLKDYFSVKKSIVFTDLMKAEIYRLAGEKYQKDTWTFGYSPAFEFKNKTEKGIIHLKVLKGLMNKVKIQGAMEDYEKLFINKLYCPATVMKISKEKDFTALMKLFGFL